MLTQHEQRQLRNIEKQVAIPARRFIVTNGLAWGLCMLVLLLAIDWIVNGKSPAVQWREGYWANLLLMPLGGLLYGWLVRRFLERRYRRLKEKEGWCQPPGII